MGRLLTIDGDEGESCGVTEAPWSAAARPIGEQAPFFEPTCPAVHGSVMDVVEHGNGVMVDAFATQGGHGGAPLHLLLDQRVAAGGAE